MGGLRQRPTVLCIVLVVWAAALWACEEFVVPTVVVPTVVVTVSPSPADTVRATSQAELLAAWTRVVAAERTLSAVETLAADLVATCGALWDLCCAPLTSTPHAVATDTPVMTCTLVRPTGEPTYTPVPTSTQVDPLCQPCVVGDPARGCAAGYWCKFCDVGRWLCVSYGSPTTDCRTCAQRLVR